MFEVGNINWVRVTDMVPYIKTGDWSDEDSYALEKRVYAAEGKAYPLVCIGVCANSEHSVRGKEFRGIRISVSWKREEGAWWDDFDAYIPTQLFPDLYKMLDVVKEKYSK